MRRAAPDGFKRPPRPADAVLVDQIAASPAALPLGRPVRRRLALPCLLAAVLVVAGLWLGLHKDVTRYTVTSGSMEPTLRVGAHLSTDGASSPRVGEIVVFHPPAGARPKDPVCAAPGQGTDSTVACDLGVEDESRAVFVKRVVAGPGDVISIVAGHVIRNGTRESDPYIAPCAAGSQCSFPTPIRVPAGEYYLLGDNRGVSDDSRFWGPVPGAWIIGTVVRCSLLDTFCQPVR